MQRTDQFSQPAGSGQTTGSGNDAARQAQQKAAEVKEEAKQKAGELAQKAQSQAKERARAVVDEQAHQAAEELDHVASAVRQSGQQFRNQDLDFVARYTDQVADQVEGLSHYLNERSLDEMLEDAEELGRRQPELFLAGAFALGILAGRFFKSSRRRRYRENRGAYYGNDYETYGNDYRESWDEGQYAGNRQTYPSAAAGSRELETGTTGVRTGGDAGNDFTSHVRSRPGPLLEDSDQSSTSSER